MTNSEKLLSSFSENYFYKELVYADLKFTPTGGTEIELADLIINLEDIILAIQLKERNEKDRTQDKNIEEKWLKKKCKKAKEQIKDTISYITSEKVSFINARGKKTIINPRAEVVPLVVFENDSISEYEHLLRNHTNDGLAVNCMSIDDFKLMCKQLLSPIEIIEYLKWREAFYKKNGPINLLITETNNGFVLSKPQMNENLVQQYLYEKYGENAIYEDRLYYELFRQYVSVLYEHRQMESEINGCYEVIKFLAHLFRDEIKCFVERTEKALLIAKTKKFNLVDSYVANKKKLAANNEKIEKLKECLKTKESICTSIQKGFDVRNENLRKTFIAYQDATNEINQQQDQLAVNIEFKGDKDVFKDKLIAFFKGTGLSEVKYTEMSNAFSDLAAIVEEYYLHDGERIKKYCTDVIYAKVATKIADNYKEMVIEDTPDKINITYHGKLLSKNSKENSESNLKYNDNMQV